MLELRRGHSRARKEAGMMDELVGCHPIGVSVLRLRTLPDPLRH